MTQRLGLWMIGATLASAALVGCAQPGRPSAMRDGEGPDLMGFWNRQFHPQNASGMSSAERAPASMASTALAPVHVALTQDQAPTMQPSLTAVPAAGKLTDASASDEPPASAEVDAAPRLSDVPSFPIAPTTHSEAARREPLVEALQCLYENRYNDALQLLKRYDPATQEVALRLLPVLRLMTQKSIDQFTPEEVAALDEQLQSYWDSLRPHSQLAIDKACFCERIASFGVYDELPPGHAFRGSAAPRPGERVLLYVELRNFLSEAKNGFFVTRLASSFQIRDAKGEAVRDAKGDVLTIRPDNEKPIRSRTPLHDHCNKYQFYLPSNLAPGAYTLVIQVTDQTRPEQARVASKTIEFHVSPMTARGP